MRVAANTPDEHAFQGGAPCDDRLVIGQDQLGVLHQMASGFCSRGKAVHKVAGRGEDLLAGEQIFHLWPVNHHMLLW